jgi:hypothetical protein
MNGSYRIYRIVVLFQQNSFELWWLKNGHNEDMSRHKGNIGQVRMLGMAHYEYQAAH